MGVPSFGLAAGAAVAGLFAAAAADARPLSLPFDFSRGAVAIQVSVGGAPLRMLLDTGVDPSVIDLARAEALGLKLDRAAAGAGSGTGTTKQSTAIPTRIAGLAVAGRGAAPFDALATDLGDLSAAYGSRIDGILGYSYLSGRIALIDYPASRLTLFDRRGEAQGATASCRRRWVIPMRMLKDENWPLLPLRLGDASATATLDTGHDGTVNLYQRALDLPGVRAALAADGEAQSNGFNGSEKRTRWRLDAPLGFGPFRLPPGASVTLADTQGAADTSLANAGNRLFAALKLKLLLDYKDRLIGFYGDCRRPG
ncbi:MAG TPA: retropepsin-like aspartic protease [Caulobacteraceae bacterium]